MKFGNHRLTDFWEKVVWNSDLYQEPKPTLQAFGLVSQSAGLYTMYLCIKIIVTDNYKYSLPWKLWIVCLPSKLLWGQGISHHLQSRSGVWPVLPWYPTVFIFFLFIKNTLVFFMTEDTKSFKGQLLSQFLNLFYL